MKPSHLVALSTFVLSLACGGISSGGSPEASALCEHLAAEVEHPCIAVAVGSTVTIDGIEVTVDKVSVWEGKDSLPEISNFDERNRMKKVGNNTLALEITLKNTKPVKSEVDFVSYVIDGNGETAYNQPYNSKLYNQGKEGWIDFWDDDAIGPNKTRQASLVYAMKKDAVIGTKLILRLNEKRPDPEDPRGRMKNFVNELFVVDLGPPT